MIQFRLVIACCFALIAPGITSAADKVDFNRDIRPILSNNCFYCHGPDEGTQEAELRLDLRDAATEDRGGYAAIVPGNPDESELIARIFAEEESTIMPPPQAKKKLTDGQKELFKRWIAEGAAYQGHWAFQPVQDPAPPEIKTAAWAQNALDRFVLEKLEQNGLKPSPEAERRTLIRRLSLDLVGLLPTPEEVENFINDSAPDAYSRLVDRLLASPHYGERWGRHWLDQARYADSNGYTIDSERVMWPYRDWVIRALNEDMPFTQFTIEQLAGDLLPNATKLQKVATAFHRNTMINEEGGTDAEQFRNEAAVDRANTTATVWLGLTLGCAQCHTHKFDPITHREYFELFAFFNQSSDVNNKGETVQVAPDEILSDSPLDEAAHERAKIVRQRLAELQKTAAQRQIDWLQQLAKAPPAEPKWESLAIESYQSVSNRPLRKLDDGSILASRDGAANDTYEIAASLPVEKIAAIRLTVLPHETLDNGGSGTAGNGNFILSELELEIDGKDVPLAYALADHQKNAYPVISAIDGRKNTGWALEMGQGGKGEHHAWFYLAEPLAVEGKKITVRMRHDQNNHYLIGRFALSATDSVPATHPDKQLWESVTATAVKPADSRSKEDTDLLNRVFADLDRDLAMAQREVQQLGGSEVAVMIMQAAEKPRETYIHLRGDFLNLDKKTGPLTADTLDVLPALQPAGATPNRLDLARWLVRNDNPLTPRVTVNRVWMRYFGQGLVETENDFGTQGTPPTHAELLDYLASRFVQNGWSLKQLHRLIVTSATYRQSSHFRPELVEVDPRNQLLARQNRIRVDAEVVRDAALSASGLLAAKLGGPTVRPPQPDGVYAFTQTKKQWSDAQGPDRYRRALYTTFFRSAPYPLFTTFDAPNFSTVCTQRVRSNTPLQALTMANDVAFVEMAEGLAARVWKDTPGVGDEADAQRVRRAFQLCYSRDPSEREAAAVMAYLKKQADSFNADAAAAKAAAPAKRPADVSEPVAAAWSALARALLNTDEFITRE